MFNPHWVQGITSSRRYHEKTGFDCSSDHDFHSGGCTSSTTSGSSSQSKSSITQQQHRTTTTTPGPVLTVAQQVALAAKRNKMAMTIATSPGQALLMNALMLWFSGKQLNIFSITTTSSAITTPLSNILGVENVFRQLQQNKNNNSNSNRGTGSSSSPPDENDVINLNVPKLIYVALNLLWLGIGLYKMSSMRLLPTTSAVWSYKVVWKEMLETTSIPPDQNLFY